jgi:drug/metabolite transporter (DMT)-like permease
VAFTALLTAIVLRKPPTRREVLWSSLLFVALGVSGLRGGRPGSIVHLPSLLAFLALPLALGGLLLALRRRPGRRGRGLAALLAAVSGSLGGYMVLPMRAVQIGSSLDILAWFSTPYLYCYLAAGASSFILIQLAYKDGELQSVSPAYYGLQVLWPALASYAVLGSVFDPIQGLAFAVVALSVWMIAREKDGPTGP